MCNITNVETRTKILRFIDNYTRRNKRCPSIREIAASVGLKSLSTAHGYIERMRKDGLIISQAHRARTIQINRKQH